MPAGWRAAAGRSSLDGWLVSWSVSCLVKCLVWLVGVLLDSAWVVGCLVAWLLVEGCAGWSDIVGCLLAVVLVYIVLFSLWLVVVGLVE